MKLMSKAMLGLVVFFLVATFGCQLLNPEQNDDADITPPSEVSNLSASVGNGQVTLNWTELQESDFVEVEITYTPNGTIPITATKGTVEQTFTDLINGTAYTFTVRTGDDAGNKSTGSSIQATPEVPGAFGFIFGAGDTDGFIDRFDMVTGE